MLTASGFFTFVHIIKTSDGIRSVAVAYKPPGPTLAGAVEELLDDITRGPELPDAVVILETTEDVDGIGTELGSVLSATRLAGRVPLLHASIALSGGSMRTVPVDQSMRSKTSLFLKELSKIDAVLKSGMQSVFRSETVVLRAPPGYVYEKPSGTRERFFLKPDLALTTSASVSFVALALFRKLFADGLTRAEELRTVFVDTMAIAPVAYAFRDLLDLCRPKRTAFLIESFHSYGGVEKVPRPLPRTSICLISASASMSLHQKWLIDKEVGFDEVVTLLTVDDVKLTSGALFAVPRPVQDGSEGPAQLSIRLKGEAFMPDQELPKKVLLREPIHGSKDDVAHFPAFCGTGVFDVFRRPRRPGSKVRALYVDGDELQKQECFELWLKAELLHRAKAVTRVVVFQNDESSKRLAKQVQALLDSQLGLKRSRLIAATSLRQARLPSECGVIICAAVIGKGSQLLEVSRALRDVHFGPRLYLVGYQVAETREELRALPQNLKHSKSSVPHDFVPFGCAAVGSQLATFMAAEMDHYYRASSDVSKLPRGLAVRAQRLGQPHKVETAALLPSSDAISPMQLRAGFAYWPKDSYTPRPCHAEVLATVGVLLQRAREHDKLAEENRLGSRSFQHVMLDPENFARYNDGVVQAALLRNAYPSELDYRGDQAASSFMRALIERVFRRVGSEGGEAALEFILALQLRRLQVSDAHLQELLEIAPTVGSPAFKKAVQFLLKGPTYKSRRSRMPF